VCQALQIPPVQLNTEKSPHGVVNILNINELEQQFNQLENDQNLHSCSIDQFDWKDHKAL
jgi:hypothetical protein